MKHVREQMRNAVKGVLATVPGIQTVCSISRIRREFQENEFPVAAVGIAESLEARGRNASGSRPVVRQMSVAVSLAVRVSDDPEDALDDLSIPVEKALADPAALGIGGLIDWRLTGSSYQSDGAEDGLAVLELSYSGAVTTLENAPEINIHS